MATKIKSALDLQKQIYLGGLRGDKPRLPLNMNDLQEMARYKLTRPAFDYLDGGAGQEKTISNNRQAFENWKIVPNMLRDVSSVDTSVKLFGFQSPSPFFLSPIGVLELAHPHADLAVARACAATNTSLMISNQASTPMEDISLQMPDTPRFFQLYWSKSDDLVESLVSRAEACGCLAIVVTLDTTFLGWRVRDLEHAFLPFLYGMGLAQYVSDPVFNRLLAEEPPMSAYKPKPNLKLVASLWKMAQRYPGSTWRNFLSRVPLQAIRKFIEIYMNPSLQWDDLARLRKMTKLPLILKGIQHPDDARKAVDLGVEGIFVSNHGGRQIDGAIGSLDALYNVKRAVGDQVTILFDSGIRSGSDAFKALALGAHAIGIGRPYAYGLGINGMSGVQDVIEALRADFELTMALTGCKTIGEISSQNVAGPILRD